MAAEQYKLSAAEWLVLDNLKNNWNYWTNLNRDLADKTYLRCVANEWIKDGRLTPTGTGMLLVVPYPTS